MPSITRRALLATGAAIAAGAAFTPAFAGKAEVFSAGAGVAINGYDPVAYFNDDRAVKGSSEHVAQWKGAQWRFASAANREAFEADPERYAPQYGGYCAWAVSQGYTARTDPDAYSIVDGKLYLNYSKGVRATWSKDIPGNIAKGDANWPGVLN